MWRECFGPREASRGRDPSRLRWAGRRSCSRAGAGEAIAGQGGQHQVERVLGAPAVRDRVGEQADGPEHLDHQAGFAADLCGHQRALTATCRDGRRKAPTCRCPGQGFAGCADPVVRGGSNRRHSLSAEPWRWHHARRPRRRKKMGAARVEGVTERGSFTVGLLRVDGVSYRLGEDKEAGDGVRQL
jgi:hypothetical protein